MRIAKFGSAAQLACALIALNSLAGLFLEGEAVIWSGPFLRRWHTSHHSKGYPPRGRFTYKDFGGVNEDAENDHDNEADAGAGHDLDEKRLYYDKKMADWRRKNMRLLFNTSDEEYDYSMDGKSQEAEENKILDELNQFKMAKRVITHPNYDIYYAADLDTSQSHEFPAEEYNNKNNNKNLINPTTAKAKTTSIITTETPKAPQVEAKPTKIAITPESKPSKEPNQNFSIPSQKIEPNQGKTEIENKSEIKTRKAAEIKLENLVVKPSDIPIRSSLSSLEPQDVNLKKIVNIRPEATKENPLFNDVGREEKKVVKKYSSLFRSTTTTTTTVKSMTSSEEESNGVRDELDNVAPVSRISDKRLYYEKKMAEWKENHKNCFRKGKNVHQHQSQGESGASKEQSVN